MKRRYLIVSLIFLSVIILSLTPSCRCQEPKQPFELIITTDNDIYVAGDEITVNVKITNNSGKGVWLVKPQDGSEQGFRYPYCIFEVIDKKGVPVKDTFPACKTTSPLNKNGFVYLKPGEALQLYDKGYRLDRVKILPEGDYTVIFSYATNAQKESQWHGLYSDDYWATRNSNEFWRKRAGILKGTRRLLQRVPPLNLTSNPVAIKIVGVAGIPKEEALAIAQQICSKEGWEWKRVNIVDHGTYWDINTNWGSLGRNALIRIDKRTGEVLEKRLAGP